MTIKTKSKAAPVPAPVVDPAVEQQRAQAEQDKLSEIQKSVSDDTDQLLRRFGASTAMSGGTMRAPILGY